MSKRRNVLIPLAGVTVTDTADGSVMDLGDLPDVNVMVLMRHRH